jgi:DNA-binding NtrC family response regulator
MRLGDSMLCVLVVEDDEQVRVLAEAIIQDSGHRTMSAATVPEALALLEGDTSIEALFTDIKLVDNGPSGLDLAVAARETRPRIRVLYTTGQGITDGMKALMVETSAFLPKPYTPDQLSAMIVEIFRSN